MSGSNEADFTQITLDNLLSLQTYSTQVTTLEVRGHMITHSEAVLRTATRSCCNVSKPNRAACSLT